MKFLPIVLALILSAIATDSALACGGPCPPPPPPKKHHPKPTPVPPPPVVVVTPAPTPAPVVPPAPAPALPAASAPAPQSAPYEAKNPSLYEYCVYDEESHQMQKRRTSNTTPPGPAPIAGICAQATKEPVKVAVVLPQAANASAPPPAAILRHAEPVSLPEPQPVAQADVAVPEQVAVEPEPEDLSEVVNVGDGTAAEEWAE